MSVTEATVLNGGEQTIGDKTTGFLLGQEADSTYIAMLQEFPDTIARVPFEQVSIEAGFNCRNFDNAGTQDHVAEISNSVAVRGVEVPVFVRVEGRRIIVTDGEVRTRAVYKANDDGKPVEYIPCLLSPNANDEVSRVEDQIVKNSGRQFSMTEQVAVINKLQSFGYTKPQILDRLGFSRTMFARLMILAEAPQDVFDHASKGEISPSAVVQLMTTHREAPPEEISKIVKKAVTKAQKDAAAAQEAGKSELKGAATQAKASDIAAVIDEDEELVKTPTYNKATFLGALDLLQNLYESLEKRLTDKDRETYRGYIFNYCESINVDITQPLPVPKAPMTEEEKAARLAEKEKEKAAREAEKEAERARKEAAKAEAQKILEAAGIKPRERKPKAEASENGETNENTEATA